MATTTLVLFLELLSSAWDDWWSVVTTGAGSATTIVDSKLAQLSPDTDFCEGWWVRNVATGEVRLVTAYATGTTTITHVSMTAVGNAATYELHRIHPDVKMNALRRAAEMLYPHLHLKLRDETIAVDDRLSNGDFETAVSGGEISGWTRVGSPTITSNTTLFIHGVRSLNVVADGGADGQLYQAVTININELTGKSVHFRCWVYATAASTARIRLSFDGGSTFTNHAFHSGNDQWEHQELAVSVPSTATSLRAYLYVLDGGTVRFDLARLWVGQRSRYTIPTAFLGNGPHLVSQQVDELEPDGRYLPLGIGNRPIAGRLLRLEGMGLLSRPTTDAGTFEIGPPQTELLLAQASLYMARAGFLRAPSRERGNQGDEIAYWQAEVERLKAEPSIRMTPMGAHRRDTWNVTEDSSGRYLNLLQWR